MNINLLTVSTYLTEHWSLELYQNYTQKLILSLFTKLLASSPKDGELYVKNTCYSFVFV